MLEPSKRPLTPAELRLTAAPPTRTIPATTKLRLEIPEHLQVIDGKLDQIEDLLGQGRQGVAR